MTAYLTDWLEWSHQAREEQRRNPPPVVARLIKYMKEREAMQKTEGNDSQVSAG